MIVTPQPLLVNAVTKYHIGEVWDEEHETFEDLGNKIQKILDNYDEYCIGMKLFNNDFNMESEMKKLIAAISQLI